MVSLDSDAESAHRLFLLSAGKIRSFDRDLLSRCDVEPGEDPGEAWNGLTIGAHTSASARGLQGRTFW